MHMADALISVPVGSVMWGASAVALAYSSKKLSSSDEKNHVVLMGVAGAFIFAAQMINFAIPLTGSSGHLGGGLLLALLLGAPAAFLTMFSVLSVQALFFGDGGLLALGCNIFNLGFVPAFIIYPLIYLPLVRLFPRFKSALIVFSAVCALELGSFLVVLETFLSGVSSLPFDKFLILMLPIHLIIGLVEGATTALIIKFISKAAPEVLETDLENEKSILKPILTLFFIAVVVAGGLSYLASDKPDGLEWSVEKLAGGHELANASESELTKNLANLQEKLSFSSEFQEDKKGVSGVIGSVITLLLALGTAFILIKKKRTDENNY